MKALEPDARRTGKVIEETIELQEEDMRQKC